MSILYVTEQGANISLDGGYFIAKNKSGLVRKIPRETLESIAIFSNAQMTTQCTEECLKRGISVSYFSRSGSYFGRLASTGHNNITRLKKQIQMSEKPEFSLELSKRIVTAKIHNQTVLLRRYARRTDIENIEEIKQIKIMESKVYGCTSINQLMGYEGIAARYYFQLLGKLVKEEFHFEVRSRRPPRDPFNSMLSLGYTLLMYEIVGEIENHSLNAYCGYMHQDRERHPTLASDLMEEWRAVLIDSTVMSLVQGNEIKLDQFEEDDETGGYYLTPEAMKIFLNKLEQKMKTEVGYLHSQPSRVSYRRALWIQVGELVHAIEREDPQIYEPVWIR